MKKPYSDPKICTGGVDVSRWSTLSEKDKKQALAKRWYVYFSFRNPKTGKLKRQTPISKVANQYKTMQDRLAELRVLQRNLLYHLERGASPYGDNTELARKIFPSATTKQKSQHPPYPGKNATNTAGVAVHYSQPEATKSATTFTNGPSTISLLLPPTVYQQSALQGSKSPVNKANSLGRRIFF